MQALSAQPRLRATTQAFTTRQVVVRPVAPCTRLNQQQQTASGVVTKASSAAFDLSEFAGDVDLNVSSGASAPMASENVRLRIRMRGYDTNLLADAVEQVRAIAMTTGSTFKGPVMLPTRKKLYCVLRSPHVNKDSREHFEIRTHHRWVAGSVEAAPRGTSATEGPQRHIAAAGLHIAQSMCL